MTSPHARTLSALPMVAVLALTSCGTEGSAGISASQDEAAEATARIHSKDDDLWVRASDADMTSLFGTIENLTDEDLEIVAAESDAAERVELHEIVVDDDGQEVMQEIDGGFPLPADGALELEPGGDHLMLMGLHEELHPGDVVHVSLEFEDGTTEGIDAIVKEDGGQDKPYDHEGHGDDHEDDHEDTDSDSAEHEDGDQGEGDHEGGGDQDGDHMGGDHEDGGHKDEHS